MKRIILQFAFLFSLAAFGFAQQQYPPILLYTLVNGIPTAATGSGQVLPGGNPPQMLCYGLNAQGQPAPCVFTGGSVTWPATGDIVVSNSTNSPAGLAPANGECVVGNGGAWIAGSCAGTGGVIGSGTAGKYAIWTSATGIGNGGISNVGSQDTDTNNFAAPKIGSVLYADQFSGADMGAQILAAINYAITVNAGIRTTIDARNYFTTQTTSTNWTSTLPASGDCPVTILMPAVALNQNALLSPITCNDFVIKGFGSSGDSVLQAGSGYPAGGTVTISSWSITSDVVTFQTSAQALTAGQSVTVYGFGTSTFFNGYPMMVTSTGLTTTQFEAYFAHANGSATESGSGHIATPLLTFGNCSTMAGNDGDRIENYRINANGNNPGSQVVFCALQEKSGIYQTVFVGNNDNALYGDTAVIYQGSNTKFVDDSWGSSGLGNSLGFYPYSNNAPDNAIVMGQTFNDTSASVKGNAGLYFGPESFIGNATILGIHTEGFNYGVELGNNNQVTGTHIDTTGSQTVYTLYIPTGSTTYGVNISGITDGGSTETALVYDCTFSPCRTLTKAMFPYNAYGGVSYSQGSTVTSGVNGQCNAYSSAHTMVYYENCAFVTGTTTIKIPHAITGQIWDFIYNSGSNTVTVEADSGNINGVATLSLLPGQSLSNCEADGTNTWCNGYGTVTSVGFTGGLISVANPTTTPAFTVAGTSGGVPYFSSTSAWASSALLATNALVVGGGAGTAPTTGNGDFTYSTHTLSGGSSALVNLAAANALTLGAMTGTACLEEVSGVVTSTGSACGSGGGITFPQTVAGTTTSGGIPYFSNTTTLTSSSVGTANAPILWGGSGTAPGTGHATDNGTVWAFTEGQTISPSSTSQVGLTVNNPSGTSVDIADLENNGTKEVTISNGGNIGAAGNLTTGGNTSAVSGGTGGVMAPVEGTVPTTVTGGATLDVLYGDSSLHAVKECPDSTSGTFGTCLPVAVMPATSTAGDLLSVTNSNGYNASDSTVVAANVVTQTSNASSGQVCTYTGSNKVCVPATLLPNGVTATTQSAGDSTADVATDSFVTTAVANAVAGVNPAVAVLAASTATIAGTYVQVGGGIGDTFTVTATGAFTLDGIAINTIGQRVLLKNQSSANQNGIYTATVVGTTGISPIFTRALDYDTPSDVNNTGAIPVQSGTVNTTTSWLLTSQVTSIGSSGSSLTYAQFSIAPSTLVTSAAALAANGIVTGAGSQGIQTTALTGYLYGNGTSAPTASTTIPLTGLATQGADTFVANDTASTAAPTAVAMPTTNHGVWVAQGTAAAPVATAAGTSGQVFTSGGSSTNPGWIDFPERLQVPAANCNNATAGAGWSIGSGGTVTCRAGTNNLGGYVTITDTSSTFAQFALTIPVDWDTATNPYIKFYFSAASDTTSGHTIIPAIKVSCPTAGNGTVSDDATFSASQSSSTVTIGASAVANGFYNGSSVQIGSTQMTGCIAGGLMIVQVGRASDSATGAINFWSADVTFPRLIAVQAN